MRDSTVASLDYDLLTAENRMDPYPVYARLREEAPIHWSNSLGGWVFTRFDEVHDALDEGDLSAARFTPYLEGARGSSNPDPESLELYEGLNAWFTFADPPNHTRLRSLTRNVVSPPMKAMRPAVEALIGRLLDEAEELGETDMVNDLARTVSVTTIATLLGVPFADQQMFLNWAEVLTAYIGGAIDVPDRRRRALQGLRELSDYLHTHVEERRAHPGEDLVSALLAARKDGDALSVEEIVATSAMMLFAGHGSSTNAIGNGMLALLQNPDQYALLAAGEVSATHAVEELLRYDSPVHVTVRTALSDGVLGREEISTNDRVFLFIAAANRDPRRTERPEQLDFMRGKRVNHVTFGYGIHFCLGAPLARMEATLLLEKLVERFSRVELATDELQWKSTVGFRGLESLPLTVRA